MTDLSKIPNLEGRREAARLWEASVAAQAALEAAQEAKGDDLDAKYGPLFEALENEYRDKRKALRQQKAAEMGIGDLEAKSEAADQAYSDHPLTVSTTEDDEGNEIVQRCGMSGEPILEDDEVHTDGVCCNPVLSCLLGIAPKREAKAA